MKSNKLRKIRKNLHFLEDKYDVVIYGSYVEGGMRPNSDIDIALISHETQKE